MWPFKAKLRVGNILPRKPYANPHKTLLRTETMGPVIRVLPGDHLNLTYTLNDETTGKVIYVEKKEVVAYQPILCQGYKHYFTDKTFAMGIETFNA
jgi:hypothetical protein